MNDAIEPPARPATSPRSPTWLMIRLALRRWRNRFASGRRRKKGATTPQVRTAPRQRGAVWLLMSPFLVVMLSFAIVQQFATIDQHFGDVDEARRAKALLVGLWFVGVLLTELSTAALDTAGWDLEWLASFPCSIGQIARARITTRAAVSPYGWAWLMPCAIALAWNTPLSFGSVLVAAIAAVAPLLVLCAVVLVFAEIALHVVFKPSTVRNVKAVASIGAGVVLFGSMQMQRLGERLPAVRGLVGTALDWTPLGLLVRVFDPAEETSRLVPAVALLAEVAVVAIAGVVVLEKLVGRGLVVTGARTGRRAAPRAATPSAPLRSLVAAPAPIATDATTLPVAATPSVRPVAGSSPLLGREFKLLRRDFNYLAQAFLLPIVIAVFQLGVQMRHSKLLDKDVPTLCAWGFGVATYTYLQSALRTLALERDSFWVLFTFPRPLSELLAVKAKLYAVVGLVFAVVFLACGAHSFAKFQWSDLSPLFLSIVGVPVFAYVMTAFGALTTRVLDPNAPRRASPSVTYGAMVLIAIFTGTIAAGSPWRALSVLVLTVMLAASLWQRAADRLPYLLDADATIPPKLSLLHGIVGLLAFVVLQGVVAFPLVLWMHLPEATAIFFSYAISGVVVCGFMWTFLGANRVATTPWVGASRKTRSIALGIVLGLGCAAIGLGWQWIAQRMQWFSPLELERFGKRPDLRWLAALAVVAAPLCEEFLFRGLVFGGLRRSFSVPRAIVMSAALFAIVHPLLAVPPVFVVGLVAAFACEKTGSLLAPIVTHAVYNAIVVAAAWTTSR